MYGLKQVYEIGDSTYDRTAPLAHSCLPKRTTFDTQDPVIPGDCEPSLQDDPKVFKVIRPQMCQEFCMCEACLYNDADIYAACM